MLKLKKENTWKDMNRPYFLNPDLVTIGENQRLNFPYGVWCNNDNYHCAYTASYIQHN